MGLEGLLVLHNKDKDIYYVGGSDEIVGKVVAGERVVPEDATVKMATADIHNIVEKQRSICSVVVMPSPSKAVPATAFLPGLTSTPSRKSAQATALQTVQVHNDMITPKKEY